MPYDTRKVSIERTYPKPQRYGLLEQRTVVSSPLPRRKAGYRYQQRRRDGAFRALRLPCRLLWRHTHPPDDNERLHYEELNEVKRNSGRIRTNERARTVLACTSTRQISYPIIELRLANALSSVSSPNPDRAALNRHTSAWASLACGLMSIQLSRKELCKADSTL
eukprot:3296306-Pyramimonas_sp.AAC.2